MPKTSTKLQGFLREYCISLHLSCHPCIVGLFGIAFQSNEHYCFAQELVIGRDLFAVIQPKVSQALAKTRLREEDYSPANGSVRLFLVTAVLRDGYQHADMLTMSKLADV